MTHDMKHNEMKQDRPRITRMARILFLVIMMAGATEAWKQFSA